VQENGQVTLPKELRQEYRLEKGDTVVFERTENGWLIRKDSADPLRLLDELGAALEARGISLDDLIASGRDIRGELLREKGGPGGDK
jgi:AbrB family looped-hinge helix DNA binding protein